MGGFTEHDAMTTTALKALRRQDYLAPDHLIDTVELEFDLHEDHARVRARLAVRRNPGASGDGPLVLLGEELETVRVAVDGVELAAEVWARAEQRLELAGLPAEFVLETEVLLHPEKNTQLSGLYCSGGNFYTDLEPEGFRRITWFPDRPDVMARYTTRVEADRARCPALLSNGNPAGSGDLPEGRHWARWEDPHPKPSYLFAMVAGDLAAHRGTFTTSSGREVALEVWTEPENVDRCAHALASLQRAMRWDEERFGREYDLDVYMVVAVGDFNGGAMENKGLNIFNSVYVLARPETATDEDYEAIEGVIAHEYFHNWTGNRVTLRDWFQLTLKEGLTVYRDQEFSAEMNSAAVMRVGDVQALRERQFLEDAGPMAHPVRPDEVVEMGNFYTTTVYEKGAEVIRMYETLLGRDGFRRGMDLYFERHDGQAVTCDDFRAAMADAEGLDLEAFGRWYSQSGTPLVRARGEHDPSTATYTLALEQSLPEGRLDPGPLVIPVRMGLLGRDGRDLPLTLEGEPAEGAGTTRVLRMQERAQSFRFVGVDQAPVASLFRGFSAPVRCEIARSRAELAFLLTHESDPFQRWDAGQELAGEILVSLAQDCHEGRALALDPLLIEAFGSVLADEELDGSLRALTLRLPSESVVAQRMTEVDPEAVHVARRFAELELARALSARWREVFEVERGAYSSDRDSIDRRRLRNLALKYLVRLEQPQTTALARTLFEQADNMSDSIAALSCLVDLGGRERDAALEAFYGRWRGDALVLDKWFAIQAQSVAADTFERVRALCDHADFTLKNPNRMRSLLVSFALLNQVRFHRADGAAYDLVADKVIELDAINSRTAARLSRAFLTWRQFEPGRRDLLRRAMSRIAGHAGLSRNVGEVVGKALEG